jgi:hypothetical protein
MTEEAKPSGGTSLIADATTVAETSVMKDLLGRSAKAFGDYLGEHVEEYVNKLRERRRKNVRDHEQQVERVTGGPVDFLAEGDRGGAIERWVIVAADVPLEDPERAAFVEATLAEILTSNRSSEFQDVAERLSGPSMRILLNAPSDRKFLPGADDRRNFETLRELGLARKFDLARFLLLLLAWCVGTAVGFYSLTRILPPFLPTTMSIGFELEGAVISGVIFAVGMALLFTNYTLTEFGKRLQGSALRFYRTRTKLREFRIASLVPSGFLSWAAVALVLACGIPLLLSRFLQGSETIRTIVLSPPRQSPPTALPAPSPNGAPQAPQSAQTLATEDVAMLIDVWRSVTEQMKSTIDSTNQIEKLLSSWPKQINEERGKLLDELNVLRDEIEQRRVSITTLGNFYQRFPNIHAAIRDRNSDEAFRRLYLALDAFITEVRTLPAKLPQNFESSLKPYADEVKLATTELAKWANDTQSFSEAQVRELSTAK